MVFWGLIIGSVVLGVFFFSRRKRQVVEEPVSAVPESPGASSSSQLCSTVPIEVPFPIQKTDVLFSDLSKEEKEIFRDEQENGYALKIEKGIPQDKKYVLIGKSVTVGRSVINDVVVDDLRVSEKHAVIRFETGQDILIEDLGSTNGTFVNGARISKANLNVGDMIRVGMSEIRLELLENPEA